LRPGYVLQRQIEEEILARFAFAHLLADRGVVALLFLIAWSKIVGFEVSPVTESSLM
jgi:hypothetical protein